MQNKNKIMVFYGILILFIISLFLSAEKYLDVAKYNKMNVIIETIPKNNNDILLKLDENIYAPKLFKNLLNQEIKTKVETMDILIKEKYSSKINNIIVFNDTKMNVYEDFSNFEKSKEKICVENKCTNYDKYKFNDEIKFDKNSKIINYNSKINTFYLFVVNFLGGNIVFLSSYILLFISIIYFINNKQYINIKLDYRFYAVACFLLAFFLRLNNIDSYAPWGDECYAVLISNPKMPFINIFNDPGNPPFYYFLLKMNLYLSNMSLLSARFLSVVFNLLAIGFLWYFVRKNFNKKIANIAFFLAAINMPLIYYSQEIRCYSLQVLLSVLIFIQTFEILKKGNIKNYLLYFIFAIFAVNTHYYQIIFIGLNFLYIFFSLLKEKRTKELAIFCIGNIAILLSFLPYYFITAHTKALLNTNFNTQLPQITFDLIKRCVFMVTGGFLSLILTGYFLYKKINDANEYQKRILCYCIFIILFVILSGLILSFVIRPMFVQKYLLFLIPFYLIILSFIFGMNYKNKYMLIIVILWLFLVQNYLNKSIDNNRKICTTSYNSLKLSTFYQKKTSKKIVHLLRMSDMSAGKFWMLYGQNYEKNSKHIFIEELKNGFDIESILKDKIKENLSKNTMIFTPLLKANLENSKQKNYTCYFNSSLDVCIWKIE